MAQATTILNLKYQSFTLDVHRIWWKKKKNCYYFFLLRFHVVTAGRTYKLEADNKETMEHWVRVYNGNTFAHHKREKAINFIHPFILINWTVPINFFSQRVNQTKKTGYFCWLVQNQFWSLWMWKVFWDFIKMTFHLNFHMENRQNIHKVQGLQFFCFHFVFLKQIPTLHTEVVRLSISPNKFPFFFVQNLIF